MALRLNIHPVTPQSRLIRRAVETIKEGGVIVYPTDSCYALGCQIGEKNAMERIRAIRRLDDKHNFTLVCRDLSEIAQYAKVESQSYRLLKSLTPGPYTFLLEATRQVPRRLLHPKRKTIGIRVPNDPICFALLDELAEPILSSTLLMPGEEMPLNDPEDIVDLLDNKVDLIIDGGFCGIEPTTVVDLTHDYPELVRQGKGNAELFS